MLIATRDHDFFWEGVDQGKLLVQCCSQCAAKRHPPAPMCGDCQSLEWTAQPLSGRGTVFSWLISKHPTRPDEEPRVVVLVDLEEGTRLVANMVPGESAEIGDAVTVTFGDYKGARLPMFTKETAR
jgi:uncharacterized protein